MKLSEFKNGLKSRLMLLTALIKYTFMQDIAYAWNNWAAIGSTLCYTVAILIFIKVIYSNINVVAGYSYNQMIFFFLISQMTFYINWFFTMKNLNNLILDVNQGNLDLVLVKPIPSLFYLTFRSCSVFRLFLEATPSIALVILIDWHGLNLSFVNVFTGLIIWLLGLIIIHILELLAALPVFWLGESESILDLINNFSASGGKTIPLEGYEPRIKFVFGSLIPILIATAFSTSVMLGKSDPFIYLIWTLIVTTITLIIRVLAWRFALMNYTSASS